MWCGCASVSSLRNPFRHGEIMRQAFHQYPWIYPEDPEPLRAFYKCHGKPAKYKKGDVIKSGGESQKLFYLVNGLCGYFINYSMQPRSFALILPGRSMCDLTSISGEKVNITTLAMRDSEVLTIPPNMLIDAMKRDAGFAFMMCKHAIAKQECSLEATMANFTHEPPMRLKVFMMALISTFHKEINDFNVLPLVLTNEEMGKIINTTRVTVNRILTGWQKIGLISRNGKQIITYRKLFDDVYDWRQ